MRLLKITLINLILISLTLNLVAPQQVNSNLSGRVVRNQNNEVSFCLNSDYLGAFGSSYYNMAAFRATEMSGTQKMFLAASLTKTENLFVGNGDI